MYNASSMRFLLPFAASGLLLAVAVGCGKGSDADQANADAPVETEAQAAEVAAQFSGVFRHTATVAGDEIVTELELRDDALQQRRNGLIVLDAVCTKEAQTLRRMQFDCRSTDDRRSRWPLEIDADGQLFHRAQPEMRYLPVSDQTGE